MEWTLYAHSLEDRPEDEWELLPTHQTRVGVRAAELAAPFGGASLAQAMGALHDAGKASDGFQTYIRGKGPSVDHSTAGAVIALNRYGAVLGRMAAFGIAGHHAGLANGRVAGGELSSLTDRLERHGPAKPLPPGQDVAPASVSLTAPVLSEGFTHHFSLPFLIRMLFSCLVDADRLETERFEAQAYKRGVDRGCALTVADPASREAALITFLASAANITLLGIGGAFWGLLIGLAAHLVLNGLCRAGSAPARP